MRSTLAYNKDFAFNAICPYFTMFPLEYPLNIIKKHAKNYPIILDPFCGRGTTIYAARKFKFIAYGFDTSPVAVAIAQAKLASATLTSVMTLAEELIAKSPKDVPDTPFFRGAFSDLTLRQVCSLREGLMLTKRSNEAVILRAAALGCLHGPLPVAGGSPSYFSNQMPRTFASKPDYSVRFWEQRRMKPPRVSVVDVLRKKLSRIMDIDSPPSGQLLNVRCEDARRTTSYHNIPRVTLTITSPPYYGMRTYIEDQWLRNWFVGGSSTIDYGNEQQLRHAGHEMFIADLAKVWKNVRSVSAPQAHLYVRFGAIPSIKSEPREILKTSLEQSGDWTLISIRNAKTADEGKRQSDQMRNQSHSVVEFDFHAIRK